MPSEFLKDDEYSEKWGKFLARGGSDVIILGNSRARDALNPGVMEQVLKAALNRDISVHSLATTGGYFPLYLEIFRDVTRVSQVRTVVLAVSPRDVMESSIRGAASMRPYAAYVQSSGYQLAKLDYAEGAKKIESFLTDLTSLILPSFYFRSNVLTDLVSAHFDVSQETARGKISSLANSVIEAEGGVRNDEKFFPRSGSELVHRWGQHVARIKRFIGFGDTIERFDPFGFPIIEQPSRSIDWRDESLKRWRKLVATGEVERARNGCPQAVVQEREKYRDTFLSEAKANKIKIVLVLLPGLWLEPCENSIRVNQSVFSTLYQLQESREVVVELIDLNQGFTGRFNDPEKFKDLEHLQPVQSTSLTEYLTRAMLESAAGNHLRDF